MSKYHIPINLKTFTIVNNTVPVSSVMCELKNLMDWLKRQQDDYYAHHYAELTSKILDENVIVKGSLNSLGRKLGITPPIPASYQPYNLAEMFRVSILSKTSAYLQNEILTSIIVEQNVPTPISVLNEYKAHYPSHKPPTIQFIKLAITRLTSTGVMHNTPTGDGVLNFWATDTHYSKVTHSGHIILFTLKLENIGLVTLQFELPKKERFKGGKVTRPNVFLDKKGKLCFGFTVQKDISRSAQPQKNVLGIDLGLVEPFTGTIVFDDNTHSAPYVSDHRTHTLTRRITRLKEHSNILWVKEKLNEVKGHEKKSHTLRIERLRVRSKISRLKIEQSHALANRIIAIANTHNATINLENLSWVPNSKWDQARQQEMIEYKARTQDIRVRKINPKNTSNNCNRCGSAVKHSVRAVHCIACVRTLNRDILASRNIAQDSKPLFLVQRSLLTRVTRPVTTGSITNYVNTLLLTKQVIQHN